MKRIIFICIVVLAAIASFGKAYAQSYVHKPSDTYIGPTDPMVQQKLKEWRDLKFGVIFHWGLYSVPGIVESWQLTCEDWITPDTTRTYEEYKQWYWGLIDEFNPVDFNPQQWADAVKRAGAKYAVVTSKHHDGFCIFPSKYSDFNIANSAFGQNPKSNALKHIFDALRAEGLWVGCYFSKPDWHSNDYWWCVKATPNRLHNYNIEQYPERWRRYQQYVYNQCKELVSDYGPIDIFWLDGGWCTPPREDIRLDSIVAMMRAVQPGLIVVDRACPGPYEDYQTPEQKIPDCQITTPWESCITLTDDWGWTPHPRFKSPARIVAMLAEVVAKGGSLLLGVGPTPQGTIDDENLQCLDPIGAWVKANGEGIYDTTITDIYRNDDSNVWFTASKTGDTLYAIVPRGDDERLPATISWKGNVPARRSKIKMLHNGRAVKWSTSGDVTTVSIPASEAESLGVVLKIAI